MQKTKFIKGQSYLIEDHPYFYQGQENGIYRFLKWDGNQRYLYEGGLDRVKVAPPNKEYEQKLRDAENEISFYYEKYMWYKRKEEQEVLHQKYNEAKKQGWFSGSNFVQLSGLLTLIGIIILSFKISIDTETFWIGLLTFITLFLTGVLVSVFVAWIAYKIEEFVDEEKTYGVFLKLVFFLPPIWYVLYRLFKFFLSKD